MIFWTRYVQARNQLGTPVGRFWEEPKYFKLCPMVLNYVQHILQGDKIFRRVSRPPCPPSYRPVYVSNYLVECRMWDVKVNSSAAIKLIAQQLS